ncbi:MAG TPA: hypothetical protein VFU50_09660 [Terriglobales bacterium]|nr:hypothetical protein [Terriglobales bacterium]
MFDTLMMLARIFGLMALAFWATIAAAQNSTHFTSIPLSSSSSHVHWLVGSERHLQPTSTGALFLDSAFAHGYRHGYDEGFHLADLDIHMGRAAQPMTKHDFRQAGHEYNSSFGSKARFQQGYQAGLSAGYADGFAGLDYQATERTKLAASGLADALPPSRREYFDEGFAGGYASAHHESVPPKGMTLDYVEQYCHEKLPGSHPPEYCSGFSRGFIFSSSVQSGTESRASARSSR